MLNVSFCLEVSVFNLLRRSFLECSRALTIFCLVIFSLYILFNSHRSIVIIEYSFQKSSKCLSKVALAEQVLLEPWSLIRG